MSDPVPAVTENEATGPTGDIFADIRRTLSTDVVNLVWRHLATMPGALQWTWDTLKPLYLGPAIGPAERVRSGLKLPKLIPLSGDALSAASIDPSALASIGAILDSYQHTNALALVCFSALISRLENGTRSPLAPPDVSDSRSAPPYLKLPRLIPVTEMAPAVARLVDELNLLGEDSDPGLLASMYRHLAHWPSYLALARTLLIPLQETGALLAIVAQTRMLAAQLGNELAPTLLADSPTFDVSPVLAAVRRFAHHPIARMTVICSLLRSATPRQT